MVKLIRGGSRGGGQRALAPAPAGKCPQLWKQFILPFVGVKDTSSWMAGPILTNYTLFESSQGALQFDVYYWGGGGMCTQCTPPPQIRHWAEHSWVNHKGPVPRSCSGQCLTWALGLAWLRVPVEGVNLRGCKGQFVNSLRGPVCTKLGP